MAAANALNRGDDDAGFFKEWARSKFQIPKKKKKPSRFKNKTEEAN